MWGELGGGGERLVSASGWRDDATDRTNGRVTVSDGDTSEKYHTYRAQGCLPFYHDDNS